MEHKEYFESNKGFGVLSTSNKDGVINSAVYARPHVMDDGSFAFIMGDRMTHQNITENPSACYLFREDTDLYKGRRYYLKKTKEEKNSPLIDELRRKKRDASYYNDGKDSFLVFFEIDKVIPLIGDHEKEY